MTATTAATPESPEALDFLRHRVSRFGFWGCATGASFLCLRLLMLLVAGHSHDTESLGSWITHALGAGFLGLAWLLTRRSQRSAGFIHAVELVGIIGSGMAYAAMGLFMPAAVRPDWIVLFALFNVLVIRAVVVPSSAYRTLAVCLVLTVPVLAVTYIHAPAIAAAWQSELVRIGRASSDPEQLLRLPFLGWSAAWWLAATAICTITSHVVFGLRREVRKAMQLGQYTLEEKLGEGGVGAVYRAHHAMLRRPTAIKLLQPDRTGEVALARFEREVQLTAQLTHPNTITVFDYGRTPEGLFYYAMELLSGANLAEVRAAGGPQPIGRVVHILSQVAGALAEAHGIGLIHRDIKPANIILAEQGGIADVAKVVDFGLVKEISAPKDATLTAHDTVVGTPHYMSPEAIRDPKLVDARGDIYALGAVGYVLLTGTELFAATSIIELCSHHLHTPPEPPSERLGSAVPAALEELLLQCLAKDPDERPASASALKRALEPLRREHRWDAEQAQSWWQQHQATIDQQRRQNEGSTVEQRQLTRAMSPTA